MKLILRWLGYVVAGLLLLALLAAAWVWFASEHALASRTGGGPEHLARPTPAQLADGEREARTSGCFSCHGDGLRGNKMFDEPLVGTVWAPNLTRVAAGASDAQLARAIRRGIGVDGRSLLIMPSEVFQHLSDQETAALIAVIRRQPRFGGATPGNSYGPLGRLGLAMGKFKAAPTLVAEYASKEPLRVGPQYEPGRRLAVLKCSGCHAADLTGQEIGPGEKSPDLTIAGAYNLGAFRTLLRTGRPAGGQKLPMMGPTARSDLSHLTDAEIAQLHGYLVARAQH